MRKRKNPEVSVQKGVCIFCDQCETGEDDFGRLLRKKDISVHYFCMLFSSGLMQNGKTDRDGILGFMPKDILKEVKRGTRLKCSYCKKTGATIGCVVSCCRRIFHFGCGQKNNVLNQFFDNYSSFCAEHRPVQTAAQNGGSSPCVSLTGSDGICSICMCSMENDSVHELLYGPCCKNAVYHRSCIQRQAIVSGIHFFKCPLCNNKEKFQEEMLQFGIYIPDQDAAWELEPNAFQELLQRHSRCDVPKCLCPNGRDYNKDDTKWEVMLCDWCGSSGTHMVCQNLKKLTDDWVCHECKGAAIDAERKKRRSGPVLKKGDPSQESAIADKGKSSYPGKTQPMKRKIPGNALNDSHGQCANKRSCQDNARIPVKSTAEATCTSSRTDSRSSTADGVSDNQSSRIRDAKIRAQSAQLGRRHSCRRTRFSQPSFSDIENDDANRTEVVDLSRKPMWLKQLMKEDIITGKNIGNKFSEFKKFLPHSRVLTGLRKNRSRDTQDQGSSANSPVTSRNMSAAEFDNSQNCYVSLMDRERKDTMVPDDNSQNCYVSLMDRERKDTMVPDDNSQNCYVSFMDRENKDTGVPDDNSQICYVSLMDRERKDTMVPDDNSQNCYVSFMDREHKDTGVPDDNSQNCYVSLMDRERKDTMVPDDNSQNCYVSFMDREHKDTGVPDDKVKDRDENSEPTILKICRKKRYKGCPRSVRLKQLRLKLKERLEELEKEKKSRNAPSANSEEILENEPTPDPVQIGTSPPAPWQEFMEAAILDLSSSGMSSDVYGSHSNLENLNKNISLIIHPAPYHPELVVKSAGAPDLNDNNQYALGSQEMGNGVVTQTYYISPCSLQGSDQPCIYQDGLSQHCLINQDSERFTTAECASQIQVLQSGGDLVINVEEECIQQQGRQNSVLPKDISVTCVQESGAKHARQGHFSRHWTDFMVISPRKLNNNNKENVCNKDCDKADDSQGMLASPDNSELNPLYLTPTPNNRKCLESCESNLPDEHVEKNVINKSASHCLPLQISPSPNVACGNKRWDVQAPDPISASPQKGSSVKCRLPFSSGLHDDSAFRNMSGVVYRMKRGISKMLPDTDAYEENINLEAMYVKT